MPKARSRGKKRGPVAAPSEAPEPDVGEHDGSRPRTLLWVTLKVLVGLSVVLVLAGSVAYGARQFAVTSERFALQHLVVTGATRFSDAQLAKLLGIKLGDNLFSLNLDESKRQLVEHPWIASANLARKLPSTLELEVEEYRAEALAAVGDTLYLVTRDGYPITPFSPSEQGDYPVVTGVALEDLAADREQALARVARGVEIVRQYERSPSASNYDAQEVHMHSDGSIQLVVGQSGITLMFGKGPIEQKLLMAARVLAKVRTRGEIPSLIFLDNEAHPERVVVRLR